MPYLGEKNLKSKENILMWLCLIVFQMFWKIIIHNCKREEFHLWIHKNNFV